MSKQTTQRQREINSGPGWYQWHKMPGNTTHIAYLYEDGGVYLPETGTTLDDFVKAQDTDQAFRLVRADQLPVVEDALVGLSMEEASQLFNEPDQEIEIIDRIISGLPVEKNTRTFISRPGSEEWRRIPSYENWEASSGCMVRNRWTKRQVEVSMVFGEIIEVDIDDNQGNPVVVTMYDIMNETFPEK
jgi:hypothetical protein